MSKIDQEADPFDRVMSDANALHDVAVEGLPRGRSEGAIDLVLQAVKDQPLIALGIAALAGFMIASASSR